MRSTGGGSISLGMLAEFVDNSTQSYYDHREELLRTYKLDGILNHLRVEATIS